MTLQTKIFGCKTNKFYAEKWLQSGELEGASGVFVVSCIVTDQAKSRWIKYIKKVIQESDFQEKDKIYLSGCGTLIDGKLDPTFWEKYPELVEYKSNIIPLGQEPHKVPGLKKLDQPGLKAKLDALRKKQQLYTRKHIVIQTGCDTFCTFCATIQARGRHKNRSSEDIIQEIQAFEQAGGKEIVLTGINLGAWGASSTVQLEESKFHELLETILEQTNIPRIRISSTGIEFVTDPLIKLYAETRINPHIHLSIQSASDSILKQMNRKYDREALLETMQKLQHIKRKDQVELSIGADLIVGFPGESKDDHKQSVDLIRDYRINKLHAFPFSPHAQAYTVPAAGFNDQIDQNTKYQRLREMIQAGDQVRDEFIQKNIGKKLRILVEKCEDHTFSGWSENYTHLTQDNFEPEKKDIRKNMIIEGYLHAPEKKDASNEKPSII